MRSSISNFSPLAADLRTEARPLARFALKMALFAAIVLAGDRLLDAAFRAGLDRYYKLGRPAAVVCVGHSHTVLGIDETLLAERLSAPVAKYAADGVSTEDRLAMIRHYLAAPDAKAPEAFVYDVDGFTFTSEGLAANAYRQFLPYMDDPGMAEYVAAREKSRIDPILRTVLRSLRYDDSLIWKSLRGYLDYRTSTKSGTVDAQTIQRWLAATGGRRPKIEPASVRAFEETIRIVLARGSKLVLVAIPTVDLANRVDAEVQQEVLRKLRAYAAENPGVFFIDYNTEYQSRYDFFSDPVHLNRTGQRTVTERLAGDLRTILGTSTTQGER